jgi:non-heme chloroperoxidase
MGVITPKDGTEIFYKDWGSGQPIVFHHGWPLSSDDWDTQMLYFVEKGYRVIAHDRRGHGRSSQVSNGHDMDHYAADAAAVVEHLDLRDAIQSGIRPAAAKRPTMSPAMARAASPSWCSSAPCRRSW